MSKKPNYRKSSSCKRIEVDTSTSLDNFIADLIKIKDALPQNAEQVSVETHLDYGSCYYESNRPSVKLEVTYYMTESDEEFNARVEVLEKARKEKEKRDRENQQKSEKETYERLRKKFEK